MRKYLNLNEIWTFLLLTLVRHSFFVGLRIGVVFELPFATGWSVNPLLLSKWNKLLGDTTLPPSPPLPVHRCRTVVHLLDCFWIKLRRCRDSGWWCRDSGRWRRDSGRQRHRARVDEIVENQKSNKWTQQRPGYERIWLALLALFLALANVRAGNGVGLDVVVIEVSGATSDSEAAL